MGYDEAALQRLARHVVARRVELAMTQDDVAAAGGPSVATLRLVERARQPSFRALTLGALDRALRWQPGTAQGLLDGADPAPLPGAAEWEAPGDRVDGFYRTYYPRVRRFASGAFGTAYADDIAKDAMQRALSRLGEVDLDRPIWPWLKTVTRDVGVDYARLQAAEPRTPTGRSRMLPPALENLPERDAAVLRAKFDGLTISDIAAQSGVSPNTVRQRLFRARRRLRQSPAESDGPQRRDM